MTLKLDDVNKTTNKKNALSEKRLAAKRLVELARSEGISLVGPDGLLQDFTKDVLEIALDEEMNEHLGYEKNHAPAGEKPANIRNGTRTKTVSSSIVGEIEIHVPRDRDSTFDPHIVKKRQRKLSGIG